MAVAVAVAAAVLGEIRQQVIANQFFLHPTASDGHGVGEGGPSVRVPVHRTAARRGARPLMSPRRVRQREARRLGPNSTGGKPHHRERARSGVPLIPHPATMANMRRQSSNDDLDLWPRVVNRLGQQREPMARSLRLTADAFRSLGILVLLTVAVCISCIGVGLPVLRKCLGLQRRHATRQRVLAGHTLGATIPESYRPVPDEGLFRQLDAILRDPATWREFTWLWIDGTAGLTLGLLPVSLWISAAWHFVLPWILWTFFPPLRTLINYMGPFLDGTMLVAYPLVSGLGVLVVMLAMRATNPILTAHARMTRHWLGPQPVSELAQRVDDLARTRSDSLDLHAAEVRRIERDLHDGTQARLVALGMNLGLAETLLADRPDVKALLIEARQNNLRALAELRELVHGIHPPVLADRGLDGAVRALALDSPLPVDIDVDLPGRPPAPAESAAYFAIAECFANAIKHVKPTLITIQIRHRAGALALTVWDDGLGGANPEAGSGLRGIARRLDAFDGTMTVTSPAGGPTTVVMELPCALSSPKISPSSETD